jgi:GTPase Era involved in 16S rRNA processing
MIWVRNLSKISAKRQCIIPKALTIRRIRPNARTFAKDFLEKEVILDIQVKTASIGIITTVQAAL